ncbi:MFS transporter [Falsigemmobacter faecalis]|uniref:MFS transporter n=1 Tax=Falsigemmobacter faecalis TaxID=2488730 RepID=A0A3P3DKT8_9RHOB|nr:MFS transporter [Falsigemmobacter faecalis]RRH74222.1 MFS transporter [Falsigemmobacter faecalis]
MTAAPRPSAMLRPGGIALLVVVIAFLCNFIVRGVVDTFMVFMAPLEAAFHWDHTALTGVYSAYLITLGLMSPLTGQILDSWGPRISYLAGAGCLALALLTAGRTEALWQLYLGPGVLCGMASSLMGMVPASALLGRWFDRQLSLMVAIAYAGFGSGMLALVPLAQVGVDTLGWRGTYGVMFWAALALLPVLALLPWRQIAGGAAGNPRAEAAQRSAGRAALRGPEWTVRSALRTPELWLLIQAFFFTAVAAYLMSVQIIAFLLSRGMPAMEAALAFGVAGMLSILGVIASGWGSQRFGVKAATLVSFLGTLSGILALWLYARWQHPALVWVFVLTFGASQGARGPVISAVNARIFARGRVSSIYGLIFLMMSLGAALGAWGSGQLYALTGDYEAACPAAALAVLLAAAPFVLTTRLTRARELPPPAG